jgi:hypothetical protein
LVTRVYYLMLPNQVVTQDQIQAQLTVCYWFFYVLFVKLISIE